MADEFETTGRAPRAALLLAVALCAWMCACGQEAPTLSPRASYSQWQRLAVDPQSAIQLDTPDELTFADADGRSVRVRNTDTGAWLEATILRSDWILDMEVAGGAWRAPAGFENVGFPEEGPPQQLTAGETRFVYSPPNRAAGGWELPPGSFSSGERGVHLKLAEGETPPGVATLAVYVGQRQRTGDTWRVSGNRFSGDGFAVRPGESLEVAADLAALPDGATLHFATTSEPALSAAPERDARVTYRIHLDGAELFEFTLHEPNREHIAWHRIDLPLAATASELRFTVEGALAHTAFIAPVIAPREAPGAVGDTRPPDILLFVADTFRADSMAAYGGSLGITPFLDAFALRGRVFRRAWSVSTHTLPAHASMFSGLYPHQAGIPDDSYSLPEEAATLAEALSLAGYRTGAVTDSLLVSDSRGIAQGFGSFDEKLSNLPDTFERALAFLDADDGRPRFLFVQTYRTHTPYRVSPRTRREMGARLGLSAKPGPDQRKVVEATRGLTSLKSPGAQRVLRNLEASYRGGVVDLDRGFGRFLRQLESRGVFESGVMLFTSDHGEAFGEHNVLYHQGVVWDELLRVPFVLFGRNMEPGVEEQPVSLVDVAPTLVDLAGLDPNPSWEGTSVLRPSGERTLFAFQSSGKPGGTLAIVEGSRKVIGFEEPEAIRQGRVMAAFELSDDPSEQRDVSRAAEWPARLVEGASPRAAQLLEPVLRSVPAALDADEIERLRAMGYLLGE